MRIFLFLFIVFVSCADIDAQRTYPLLSAGLTPELTMSVTHGVGFTNSLIWSGGSGTFDVQRAFNRDYSDAETIYSGTNHTYTDLEGAIEGKCYYRVRKNSGAWYNKELTVTISDATTGTRTCFYGNSITFGYNATTFAKGFAKNFWVVKEWTQYTGSEVIGLNGYSITPESGGTVWDYTSGGNQMPSKVNANNFCILGYGINDAASPATAANFQSALETWIDYAHNTAGWPYNRIILIGPFYNPANTTKGTQFKNAARTAASNKSVGYLSVLDFQVANSLIPSDNFHPSTLDHLLVDFWLAKHIGNTGIPPLAPSVVSITVTSATNIRVVFDVPVQATNVGWSFKKNGSANNPTAISGSDSNTLNFTVPTITTGQTILYSYDQSTGDTYGLTYTYSLEKTAATDQAVTNPL